MVGAYSLVNVHDMAHGHHTADPQAWLLAPIVDVALFAGITADAALSRRDIPLTRWGAGLRWFCGVSTWALNVWDAAGSHDPGAIVAHSVPPVVLILLAEAAPRYRQQFATVAAGGGAEASPAARADASGQDPGDAPDSPNSPPGQSGIPAPRSGREVLAELLAATPDAANRTVVDLAGELAPRAGIAVTTAMKYISASRNGVLVAGGGAP